MIDNTIFIQLNLSFLDFRRKTMGLAGNKKALEVNLPESSRKFITCIRKYMLFYLKLLEETGDISTLDRAYISLRADKRVTSQSSRAFAFLKCDIEHAIKLQLEKDITEKENRKEICKKRKGEEHL